MGVLDSINASASAAQDALANPLDMAAKASGLTSQVSAVSDTSGQITGLYEQHKDLISLTLGVPDAAEAYMGSFSSLLTDGVPDGAGLGSALTAKFSTEIAAANTAIDVTNKAATANAALMQASACMNLDLPDVAGMVGDLWDTVGSFADQAMGTVEDALGAVGDYLTNLASGFDFSAFDPNNLALVQALYDMASSCYGALAQAATKVVDFVESTALYQNLVSAVQAGMDQVTKCMGALAAAAACAPEAMQFMGAAANVIAAGNPTALNAMQSMNEAKSSALSSLSDPIDLADDLLVSKVLSEKQGEIFAAAKQSAMAASGVGGLASQATGAKEALASRMENLTAPLDLI